MNNKPDKETLKQWHADPANWKCGIFYYNKLDTRIFPPKRNPAFGWTINFGNKKSVLIFIILTAGILLSASIFSRK